MAPACHPTLGRLRQEGPPSSDPAWLHSTWVGKQPLGCVWTLEAGREVGWSRRGPGGPGGRPSRVPGRDHVPPRATIQGDEAQPPAGSRRPVLSRDRARRATSQPETSRARCAAATYRDSRGPRPAAPRVDGPGRLRAQLAEPGPAGVRPAATLPPQPPQRWDAASAPSGAPAMAPGAPGFFLVS